MCDRLRQVIASELKILKALPLDVLLQQRYDKLMAMGV
jgi:acetyl-CoA carboxylase alpha subunit